MAAGERLAANVTIQVLPRYNGRPLVMDDLSLTNSAGQSISVSRLDLLLSDFAMRNAAGGWIEKTNWQGYISIGEKKTNVAVADIAAGEYDRMRFHVGVRPEINHGNPARYPADHPLNPVLNGLHWGWANGYVFFAIEGHWLKKNKESSGYSFHIGNDPMLMTVELPVQRKITGDALLQVAVDVDKIFDFELTDDVASTHSREKDPLAVRLRDKIEKAFLVGNAGASHGEGISKNSQTPIADSRKGAKLTPYRFTFSSQFPMPELPRDNPLSEEGVELGRRLFFDKQLSINGKQSCASCHQAASAFTDTGMKFSVGAEGQGGTRNTMPIFNLAWKKSFFWDGRAPTIRDQVLQPIQNPIEMHETLTNLVIKLTQTSRTKNAAVPLTPALSLGERGELSNAALRTSDAKLLPAQQVFSPFPEGEGQGEGKARVIDKNGTESATDYPQLFSRVFGTPEITADRIAKALEQFVLTQLSYDSKFDRALEGKVELTEEEKRGFQLFITEYDPRREEFGADCFHCHGGPFFTTHSFANNGLDADFKDFGRYDVTKNDADKGKFSVPSLRNVELTAPYMHDGRFKTLEEVIDHYVSGVKRSSTLDPNIAKHPNGGVPLTDEDKKALVAFLKTLTDERYHGQNR